MNSQQPLFWPKSNLFPSVMAVGARSGLSLPRGESVVLGSGTHVAGDAREVIATADQFPIDRLRVLAPATGLGRLLDRSERANSGDREPNTVTPQSCSWNRMSWP